MSPARFAWPLRFVSRAGVILCYHGVTRFGDHGAPPFQVDLDSLRSAVRVARSIGCVVPLSELVRRHRQGRSTAGLFAFTFDDGYRSLLTVGREFFDRENLPITVFPVPDALDAGDVFWWDRIYSLASRLSEEERREFFARCGVPESFHRTVPPGFGPDRPLWQWIMARHSGRWPEELLPVLQRFETLTPARPTDRSMTWDELESFAASPGVELGVHTLTHSVLPLLPVDEQRREIETAHRRLREHFPAVLRILATPYGLLNPATERAAREAGMVATLSLRGTTMASAPVSATIPRFCIVQGERPLRLAAKLSGVADWIRRWRSTVPPEYPPLPFNEPTGTEARLVPS